MQALSAAEFQQATAVSRETLERLQTYLALLARWQKKINLVGPSTLADPWRRHVLDSAQLLPHIAAGSTLFDLGSGAGFPGLVLAIMAQLDVHLVESDLRKTVFLQEAARLTGTVVEIHNQRIESLPALTADVITARALAPLPLLCKLAQPLCHAETVCLFLKGRSAQEELTETQKQTTLQATLIASQTDSEGVLIKVRNLHHDVAR
jgi:16S rRNA (guanine527-N7)-methyltransferase